MLVNDLKDECFGRGFNSRHLHQSNTKEKMKRIIPLLMIALLFAGNAFATDPEMEGDFVFGTWRSPPKVILCDDAPISEERLISALDWWGNRGHRFKYVPLSEDYKAQEICKSALKSFPKGYIVIAKLVPEAVRKEIDMAVTRYLLEDDYINIKWAKVYFKAETVGERALVEHELGHAFGFGHIDIDGHMMHTYHTNSGWGDRALVK